MVSFAHNDNTINVTCSLKIDKYYSSSTNYKKAITSVLNIL